MKAPRHLLCYAYGRNGSWEGICVDLDIAVQGRSFEDVRDLLREAIRTYFEDVNREAPEVRAQLLSRRAPLSVRIRLALGVVIHTLCRPRDGGQANFDLPCPA